MTKTGWPRVRPAILDDAPAIADAHVRGWRTAYRGLVPDGVLDSMDVDTRSAWWRTRLRTSTHPRDDEWVWVVESDVDTGGHAAVVGFAITGPARDEAAPPPKGAGEVFAIYMTPEYIGQGLGRVLFAHAVEDLEDRGFRPVVVWVFEANPRARRFYEAAGFRADGARHAIDFGGEGIPELRYRRA